MHDYNSTRPPIILKEYGRNIQKLVEAMGTIEDKAKRTAYAQDVLKVMAILEANNKNGTENIQKCWNDLFILTDYKLDIDSPYPVPEKRTRNKQLERPAYTQHPPKFRNYGRKVEHLIQKAIQIEDRQEQEKAALEIVRLMKSFSNEWNNDTIAANLKHMSGNKLMVDIEKMKTQKIFTTTPKKSKNNGKRRKFA